MIDKKIQEYEQEHKYQLSYKSLLIDYDEASKIDRYLENNFVNCEVCGCAIFKKFSIRGESVIEKEVNPFKSVNYYAGETRPKEIIREVYYCKKHAPKIKK